MFEEEKEEIMLAEIIKGRILRHNYSTTLGLSIKSVIPVYDDLYIIKCKYLSLNDNVKGMSWSKDEDSFTMRLPRIIKEFSVLENPNEIRAFSQGNWVSMTDLQKLAEANGKVIT